MFYISEFCVQVSSKLSYQYYLTNCITEHHFIGNWAEFYGLSYQKRMRKQYPTNTTLI